MRFGVEIDLSFFSSSNPFHLCPELFYFSSQINHECEQFGLGFFSEFTGTDHMAINSGELLSFSNKTMFISYQSPPRYMYLNKISSRTDINNMQNTAQHHLYIITDSVSVLVDFSTSDCNLGTKIQVITQTKTQATELEKSFRVAFTKADFLLVKDENTLVGRILQKIDVVFDRIRLLTGDELRSSVYIFSDRSTLVLDTGMLDFQTQIMPDGRLPDFPSYHGGKRNWYIQALGKKCGLYSHTLGNIELIHNCGVRLVFRYSCRKNEDKLVLCWLNPAMDNSDAPQPAVPLRWKFVLKRQEKKEKVMPDREKAVYSTQRSSYGSHVIGGVILTTVIMGASEYCKLLSVVVPTAMVKEGYCVKLGPKYKHTKLDPSILFPCVVTMLLML